VRANQDISLTFEGGKIYAILGENGAGKSTLMKIMSGYQSADSGEIVVDGCAITLNAPTDAIAHGIGMLYQDRWIFRRSPCRNHRRATGWFLSRWDIARKQFLALANRLILTSPGALSRYTDHR
jgi:ABC-type sugar transport system ATPase subunit